MLLLSKIYLHNWHRFVDTEIEVDQSLYLAGHNGSGKSTILDALQLVMMADMSRVRFNSSAQEKSARTLDSYVRGKVGEDRYLRPGNTVCYVALEFTSQTGGAKTVLGACIEAAPQKPAERSFFIVEGALRDSLFFSDGFPRTRRELKPYFRSLKPPARVFDHVHEYQHEMLKALGGLPERFFDLFLRALTFQPLRDVRSFVEQWLLAPAPLELETLQRVAERLGDLKAQAQSVSEQVVALRAIEDQQVETTRYRSLARDFLAARDLARLTQARDELARRAREHERLSAEQTRITAELDTARSLSAQAQQTLLDVRFALESSDTGRRKAALLSRLEEIERAMNERARAEASLEGKVANARRLWDALTKLASPRFGSELVGFFPAHGKETGADHGGLVAQARGLFEAKANVAARLRTVQDDLAIERKQLEERNTALVAAERDAQALSTGRGKLPSHVERFRDAIATGVGTEIPLLCEVVEVEDPRWQDAVEGVLGARRFQLLVPPEVFDAAARLALALRNRGQGAELGLLDLDKVSREGRGAARGSLATKVASVHEGARAYVDSVLGDVMLAESEQDLRRHRRAITPQCLLYSEWSVRALAVSRFRPWQIGRSAESSQRAHLEERKRALSIEISTFRKRVETLEAQADAASQFLEALSFPVELEKVAQASDLMRDRDAARAELAGLDTTGIAELERRKDEAARALRELTERERALVMDAGRKEAEHAAIEKQIGALKPQTDLLENAWAIFEAEHPDVATRASAIVSERKGAADSAALARSLESSAKGYETRAFNETQKLTELGVAYNVRFQFSAEPGRPDETRYRDERARLELTALPDYAHRIDEEQRKAEHELQEHILHRLREQIQGARSQLERVNGALKGLEFHNESYRFKWNVSDEFREHYELLSETRHLGSGALLESEFYRKNKVAFDRFFEILTQVPQNEAERSLQARITDYRAYLDYDIEVQNMNGQVSRLSRIIGQTSGGETQTPFYLTIAASFLQLYSPRGDLRARETPRIVAFDEAFSKMDQERIASTLELFHKFGLQIITATPLERCEYLVPKMRTSLVLTAVGESVLVEPYRNYVAALAERFDEDEALESLLPEEEPTGSVALRVERRPLNS